MATIRELLDWGATTLDQQDVPRLEAQVLLAFVLGCDRSFLYAWPDKEISKEQVEKFEKVIERRQRHEPIAYIIGSKEFWSLSFEVSQNTLIPRQDTELLVSVTLEQLPSTQCDVLDLGTGCGNIACALASQRPAWRVYGVDISEPAIAMAKKNAHSLQLNNVTFFVSNWFDALKGKSFDGIIGNPPYIKAQDVHLIHGDLPFEPSIALTPGPSGLEAFQSILSKVDHYLKAGALLAFEHGFDQGEQVASLFRKAQLCDVQTFKDHAGNQRVTVGRRKN